MSCLSITQFACNWNSFKVGRCWLHGRCWSHHHCWHIAPPLIKAVMFLWAKQKPVICVQRLSLSSLMDCSTQKLIIGERLLFQLGLKSPDSRANVLLLIEMGSWVCNSHSNIHSYTWFELPVFKKSLICWISMRFVYNNSSCAFSFSRERGVTDEISLLSVRVS